MAKIKARVVPEGNIGGLYNPLTLILLDADDVKAAGLDYEQAMKVAATYTDGPCGIDIYDRNTITTTSDGLLAECGMVAIGASDQGLVNPKYGWLPMYEEPYTEEIVQEEPNLKAWQMLYPGYRLVKGPSPDYKKLPVHNAVMTGKAGNNNSASEIMNLVTMREMLFPFLGLRSLFWGDDVRIGHAGPVFSVSIGMMFPERYGRISYFPTCESGNTLHNSGAFAQTLKKDLPCVTCTKKMFAGYIIRHLNCGLVPARDIACAPSILTLACCMGKEIAWERITDRAWVELDSVGFTREYFDSLPRLTEEEILERADELIPGMEDAVTVKAADIVLDVEIEF